VNVRDASFEGIIPAIITPFTSRGEVDEEAFRENIEFLIESGVHGIAVAGSVGEFFSLATEERRRLFEIAASQAKDRIIVLAGTGAITTREAVELTESACDLGVDAALVVTPFYIQPDTEGIISHYQAISRAVDIPICLYNLPSRTNVNLTPAVVDKLADIDNVVAIKESSNDLIQMSEIIRLAGDRIKLMVGNDPLLFPALMMGAVGCISPSPNIMGKMVVDMYHYSKSGEAEKAREIQYKICLLRTIYGLGTFPTAIKEAVNLLGRPGGFPRKPALPLGEKEREKVRRVLTELHLMESRD